MVSTNCNEYTVSSVYIYTRAFISKENGVEVMRAKKTREFIRFHTPFIYNVKDRMYEVFNIKKESIIEELKQLESKATELDSREKGVLVKESYDGFTCSRCDDMEEYKFNYCPSCGYKLIDKEVNK
jgi:DNA-directed RNA polymerase subunit RPC12/RpoP